MAKERPIWGIHMGILRTYGRAALKDLESNYHKPCKWTAQDFLEKIALYKEKLKALETAIRY